MLTNNEVATANGITNQVRIRTLRALLASSQRRRRSTRSLRELVTKPTAQTGTASTGTRRESLINAAAKSTASRRLRDGRHHRRRVSDAFDQALSSFAILGKRVVKNGRSASSSCRETSCAEVHV